MYLSQSDNLVPGTWKGATIGPRRSAHICCPKCERAYTLTAHTIAEDGVITPSVVCPTEGCDFHEHVVLRGWNV